MRNVQHKKEAYWFYRFLSIFYDNYVNPFFWTKRMRSESLELVNLDSPELVTLDVGSGTGFTTQGIVEKINGENVTCIDQSPHQMAKAKQKADLQSCTFHLGDAEDLPFPTDHFDRYISAGSIEYWPEPDRGIAESYRILKPGGIALMIGPLRPENKLGRFLADTWMLFPEEADYRKWFKDAGFTDIETHYVAPDWVLKEKYGIAIAGKKPQAGESPLQFGEKAEKVDEPFTFGRALSFAGRYLVGVTAGFFFIPMAILAYMFKPLRKLYIRDVNPSADRRDPLTAHQKVSVIFLSALAVMFAAYLFI